MKMKWNDPVITILSVDKTELGDSITPNVDDSITYHNKTYWSYS